ncbi:MAG: hypothetical protein NTY68_01390 [Candidatus Micrarchaeota archaeon]|nr:hypothetical protein [Candidatus Micrarchaeota archaeon]
MKMMIAVIAMLLVSGTIAFAESHSNEDNNSGRQFGETVQIMHASGSYGNETDSNYSGDSDNNEVNSNDSDEIEANNSDDNETNSNDSDENKTVSNNSGKNNIKSNKSDDNNTKLNGSAKGSNDNNIGQQLQETIRQRQVDQLNCNAQYIINILDYISVNSNDTSAIDQAKSDLLGSINNINTSSKKEFRDSMAEYRDSVSKIRSSMVSGVREIIGHKFKLKGNNGNGKDGNESDLNAYISEQRQEFRSCFVNATRNRISAEVHLLLNFSKDQENEMDKLDKKNISTSKMRETEDELNGKINEMDSKASKMDDENRILEQKQQYMGEIRYLWIELHANKISAILAKAKAFDVNSTYASNISAVQSLLDKSVSVGDNKSYTQDEYNEAKGYLVSASDEAKSIVNSLKGNKG